MGLYEYETVVILTPGLDVNVFKNKVGFLEDIYYFKDWDDMGVKKMVYPIQGSWEGHYIRFVFATLSESVDNIEKFLKISNEVLKFITVKRE